MNSDQEFIIREIPFKSKKSNFKNL